MARRKGAGVRHRGDDVDAREAQDQFGRLIEPTDSLPSLTPQACYAVTDGREAVGTVEIVDGRFVAIHVDGHTVGRFHNLKVAVRALPHGGAP